MPAETHVNRGPIEPDEVVQLVCGRLAEILGLDADEIDLGATLVGDLGADDMALLDLAEMIEQELGERTVGFSIDDEDLGELETVGDVIDYVIHRVGTGVGAGAGASVDRPDPAGSSGSATGAPLAGS